MATIPQGILGAVLGRVGPVTGYRRNGVTIIRSATRRKDSVRTPGRLAQYEKIKLCNIFTRAFTGTDFFKRTFPSHGHSGSGYNRAMSALMHLAIQGTYPDISFSYASALISKGMLPGAINAHAAKYGSSDIVFNWDNNSETGTAKPNDKTILAAYFPDLQQAVFSIGTAVRYEGSAILNLHSQLPQLSHTWIGFLTSDEKDAADSVYAGSVII
ncbi:MAG TPA: DUF6266 family protein [Agriterribacter sp.]|nr:DUF6266 family protein [Agriterribacter sp.]